jgi:hypothetical protein
MWSGKVQTPEVRFLYGGNSSPDLKCVEVEVIQVRPCTVFKKMAQEYDLTKYLAPFLDRHLLVMLLEFLDTKNVPFASIFCHFWSLILIGLFALWTNTGAS